MDFSRKQSKVRKNDPTYKVKAKARTSETEHLQIQTPTHFNFLWGTLIPLAQLERELTLLQSN
jgi:hypothetical protein